MLSRENARSGTLNPSHGLEAVCVLQGACTYPTAEDAAAVSSRLHENNEDNKYLSERMSYKREVADLLTVLCSLPALTSLELSSPWVETWPEVCDRKVISAQFR